MRIVSLLPSATEILCALGLADNLVGITHECDYPAEAIAGKPVVTSSLLPKPASEDDLPISAQEIDERVREALATGESLYRIDHDLLRTLNPDLVLTQGLCDICAVNHKAVVAAVEALGSTATVVNLEPTTLDEILESFRTVGKATGRETEANQLTESVAARFAKVRQRIARTTDRPKTLLLEWPEPPYSAGHWNPELLALAGGTGGAWDETSKPSRTLTWDEITAFAPEMIVLIACGFDLYRAEDEAYALMDAPGWLDLPAVKSGDCYIADGNAYFNRPGPRIAESAEILATILHPEAFSEMLPPYSVSRFPQEILEPIEE